MKTLNDYTLLYFDLTLSPQGSSTLRLPYSGANNNLNVDNSTDGVNWSNDQGTWNSNWGVAGTPDVNNHFWLTWVDYADTQIRIGTYN